jgi:hypothetical protein
MQLNSLKKLKNPEDIPVNTQRMDIETKRIKPILYHRPIASMQNTG